MNEEMIFLDDSIQKIESFFAGTEDDRAKAKYFRLEYGVEIKQVNDFWDTAIFRDVNDDLHKVESELCKKLYVKGYCTIVDYNEMDFLFFKDEDDLNEWLCQMPYGLLVRHEQFIDTNGTTKEIVPEISVRFKAK